MHQAFETGTGVVGAFDEPRGLGIIRADDGVELPFHCTVITDGSRTIPEGTHVRYRVMPGHLGRWEATSIERLGDGETS